MIIVGELHEHAAVNISKHAAVNIELTAPSTGYTCNSNIFIRRGDQLWICGWWLMRPLELQNAGSWDQRAENKHGWVRMRLPSSVLVSVSLFTAETTAALYLSSTYHSAGDQIWQCFTLLFTLVPSVLVQLTLIFIHRDLSRDRPLVLLLHILQLGPIIR